MGLKSKIKGTLRPGRYVEVLPASQGEVMAGRALLVTGGASGIGRATVELLVPYGLSKVALHSSIQGVAREHYKGSIRANVVAPGMIASNINGVDPDGDLAKGFATIGEGRVIRPEEIAEVVLFLLSERSLCINGAVVPCDLGDSLR